MSKNFLKLCCVSMLLLASCAARTMEPPLLEEKGLEQVIAERKGIRRIDTTFSIVFEKADSAIRGDGALDLCSNGDLDLRVYSLGFLGLELTSRNGVIKSDPRLDSAKKTILTRGLRDSLFWWNIQGFTVFEGEASYLLRNAEREITIDKKSGLPSQQQIYFSDGKVLSVNYENPARQQGMLYQSKIKIELSRYSVTLIVKNIHFITV